MAVSESQWKEPDASGSPPTPAANPASGPPANHAPGRAPGHAPVHGPGLPPNRPLNQAPNLAPQLAATPITAGMPMPVGAGRQPWPGAMGPPVVGPPPRLSTARMPTPAAQYGAWQGALRPPVFVVNQPRPTYREPLPVRSPMVTAGGAAGAAWMLLFGLLASTARGYIWLTIISGVLAWAAALLLAKFGDRGVAVGVAAASGVAVAIAGIVVAYRLAGGDWLLW